MRQSNMPLAMRVGGLCVLTFVVGCSANSDQLKKQLKEMDTELTALRADQDRLEERLEAMELSTAVATRDQRKVGPAPVDERPRLKVIHLAPDENEEPAEAPATAPTSRSQEEEAGSRPVIHGTGSQITQTGDRASREDADPNRPVVAIHGDRVQPATRRGD